MENDDGLLFSSSPSNRTGRSGLRSEAVLEKFVDCRKVISAKNNHRCLKSDCQLDSLTNAPIFSM